MTFESESDAAAEIEAMFLELEYEPASADRAALDSRLATVCGIWSRLTTPYEFLKLAHFLEGDTSIVACELYDAALRTAWRLRTIESDPWDDEWWIEAVEVIQDAERREDLRRFAASSQ